MIQAFPSQRRTILLIVSAVVLLVYSLAFEASAESTAIVLHCGSLIDTLNGSMLGPTTVVVQNDRIKELVPGTELRPGAAVIELTQQTCMPGLSDMHVHLSGEADFQNSFHEEMTFNIADWVVRSTVYARRTLMSGFTTVRDVGDHNYEVVALRDQIDAGWVPGPRIFACGPAIGSTGGHTDETDGLRMELQGDPGTAQSIINGSDEARKAVRLHYKHNVDCIKIVASGGVQDESKSVGNPQLTEDEIKTLVDTAHDYGYTVATHAHGADAMRRAVIGGVDSIEHGTFMTEQVMELMKQHGTFYVPTMYTATFVTQKAKIPGAYSPAITRKALTVGPQIMKTVAAAYSHGVTFAYGTDEGVFPHGENWKDFPLLLQAGVPPMYTIQMATINAARLLNQDADLGSITPGKFADIIAVPGNPLTNIQLMGKVTFVMRSGVVYKQDGKEILRDSAPQ
jgi:imidazolonepropionase-like amidohydrolase